MTAERWAHLKELFEAALEREPTARRAYVAQVCAADPELLRELESLINQHEQLSPLLVAERPEESSSIFAPGQVVANRFTIRAFVGRGGMGEVYEADDLDLRERVALKTLRPELAADQRNVQRLIQEIQAARRVSNPHVCRVHDLARHTCPVGEILFLTMAFVPGETLWQRIHDNGPFAPPDALRLARQISIALDAIHAEGIVHRDLKTSNVMLRTGPGGLLDAFVTDFGLARSDAGGTGGESLTETGHLIGTPAYMAPEVLAGCGASAASDIYAFGVVLCELATGEKSLSLEQKLDDRWKATIRTCLAPEPEKRFASAGDVYRSLVGERLLAQPIQGRRINWPLAAATSFILVALFALGLRLYDRAPGFRKGATLLVTPLVNNTQDRDLDGIREMLWADLEQSSYFNLWDRARLPGVLKEMGHDVAQPLDGNTAREVALRENIPLVLFASLSGVGDSLALNLRLEELGSRTIFSRSGWTYSSTAENKAQLPEAVHWASDWVRRTVGESGAELAAQDRLPQDVTTSSWQALGLYGEAEQPERVTTRQARSLCCTGR